MNIPHEGSTVPAHSARPRATNSEDKRFSSNISPPQRLARIGLLGSLILAALLTGMAVFARQVAAPASLLPPSLFQALKWRNIGPFRGGRVVAVTGIPADSNTYYFGGVGGGVFKTTNGGDTWTNITDGFLKTSSVGAIAVAPSDPNVIYVGMGEYTIRNTTLSYGDGVYKSTDAGHTWVHLGLEDTRVISRIRVDPRNPNLVFVAAQGTPYVPSTDRGIYRSRDGGATWRKVLYVNETTGPSDLAMDPANSHILYAAFWDHQRKPWDLRSGGPGSAIYKSTDDGDTWHKIDDGLPPEMGHIGIATSSNPARLYALVECNPKGGLYRSDDAGKTWKLVNASWNLISRPWYYMRLVTNPGNPDVVWVMNSQTYKSTDGGVTFERMPVPHGDNHDIWINPLAPANIIIGNDGGATISRDGGRTWSPENNQPTGQFYRVNTDDRFPYRVYGGQQDATTVSIASAAQGPGIGPKDWHAVGGCESGYVAFNPQDPSPIYAGCWGGQFTRFDPRGRDVVNIMPYPLVTFGLPLSQLKYRFNYNAPVLVSRHDPNVLYAAGQVLFRSNDRGRSWQVISPDLTHPTPETQGVGGGPFWAEGEIYDTITTVAESPRDANVLWTGSDDGVIALTRDGGKTWHRLALPGLPRVQVNAISASPYSAATAYVAATLYKFNDYRPYAFKTTDFGKTWQPIDNGIPNGSWTHVIREDPVRRGMLFAGTETGVFVSFDDGLHWQSLQLNLPVTPVTDLQVHGSDLVASTSGRAFWILDDITPLRQADPKVAASAAFLYQPRPAIRTDVGAEVSGSESVVAPPTLGTNPPRGAILDFYLKKEVPVTLDILDATGHVVRQFNTETPKDRTSVPIHVRAGENRIVWGLHNTPPTPIAGAPVLFRMRGRFAMPGTYKVRLTAGGEVLTEPLEVREDPRIDASPQEFIQQNAMLAQIEADVSNIYHSVRRIRSVRNQIEIVLKKPAGQAVATAGNQLIAQLTSLEHALVYDTSIKGQQFIVAPTQLSFYFNYLHTSVNEVDPEVTAGDREVFNDLSKQWAADQTRLATLLGPDLDALNKLVSRNKLPVVTVPN